MGFPRYVPVAERKILAQKARAEATRQGKSMDGIRIEGREIAASFWGKAWCTNLERYADFENRIGRGRTYVRNGSVVDLQIAEGRIDAKVMGSRLYKIHIDITPLPPARWKAITKACAGSIASAVDLLEGRLSDPVMKVVTAKDSGLFPSPKEIHMACNCPDWADLCKHLAAVLYGVGSRLDSRPELLFTLRGVKVQDLVGQAAKKAVDRMVAAVETAKAPAIKHSDLGALFGIQLRGRSPKTRKKSR